MLLFPFCCLELSNNAFAGVCRNSGDRVTPNLQTTFDPLSSKEIKEIREKKDLIWTGGDYRYAFEFVREFGNSFADLVFSEAPANGETLNIVIAMGGAEPLEILLRQIAEKRNLTNIRFIRAYLTRPILGRWIGSEVGSNNRFTGKSYIGFGDIPAHLFHLSDELPTSSNSPDDVREYLNQLQIYQSSKIVVVDTGFDGTTTEAVHYFGNQLGYRGSVVGAMLSHSKLVVNSVPIKSLYSPDNRENKTITWWTHFIQEGYERNPKLQAIYLSGFQRSIEVGPVTKLGQVEGRWQPVPTPRLVSNPDEQFKHRAMALGFWDALSSDGPDHP